MTEMVWPTTPKIFAISPVQKRLLAPSPRIKSNSFPFVQQPAQGIQVGFRAQVNNRSLVSLALVSPVFWGILAVHWLVHGCRNQASIPALPIAGSETSGRLAFLLCFTFFICKTVLRTIEVFAQTAFWKAHRTLLVLCEGQPQESCEPLQVRGGLLSWEQEARASHPFKDQQPLGQ